MNLQAAAENEGPCRTRSKLEEHREAIFALRRKHWTHRQIAEWLNQHGVPVTLSTVHRFCQRAIARRPRSGHAFPGTESMEEPMAAPFPIPTPQNTTKPTNQYRFNLDI